MGYPILISTSTTDEGVEEAYAMRPSWCFIGGGTKHCRISRLQCVHFLCSFSVLDFVGDVKAPSAGRWHRNISSVFRLTALAVCFSSTISSPMDSSTRAYPHHKETRVGSTYGLPSSD